MATQHQEMSNKERMMDNKIHYSSRYYANTLDIVSLAVWPCMLLLPLVLTSDTSLHYSKVFPLEWYEVDIGNPKPLGLTLGILAVFVGQIFIALYHYYVLKVQRNTKSIFNRVPIQKEGAPMYDYFEGLLDHLSQPEGFVLLTLYLSGTWMCNLMPSTYYSFDGEIDYVKVALCLICQDGIQYAMHRLEHVASPEIYKRSHKPHHR